MSQEEQEEKGEGGGEKGIDEMKRKGRRDEKDAAVRCKREYNM